MKITMTTGLNRTAGLWLTCVLLAACGSGSGPENSPAVATPTPSSATQRSVTPPPSNRAKAVVSSPGAGPVALEFELASRPELGKPLEMKLSLQASQDVSELNLEFKSESSLEFLAGTQASFATLRAGESLTHSVTVRSTHPGIFVTDVQLTATVQGHPGTMTFAIPVVFSQPATP